MVSAGLGALTGLAAFPGIWEPRNGSRASPRRAAVHAERPPVARRAAVHAERPPAARRRRWRPSRAAVRAEAGRIARDAWRVVRVPSFLVLLAEHVTDLTGGVSGFAVQYFQARALARVCSCPAFGPRMQLSGLASGPIDATPWKPLLLPCSACDVAVR